MEILTAGIALAAAAAALWGTVLRSRGRAIALADLTPLEFLERDLRSRGVDPAGVSLAA